MINLREYLLQLKSIWQQAMKNRNQTYRYYNFWYMKDPNKVWFSKFIEYRNLNPAKKPINLLSVFGSEYTYLLLKSPKIFFTGEDLQSKSMPHWQRFKNNLIGKVDLSLGFEYINHPKYLRFPFWMVNFLPPDVNYDVLKNLIQEINDLTLRNRQRKLFACQISRHDANGVREEIIKLLQEIDHVDCAGTFMKNTDALQKEFHDDKLALIKKYKFNICPENSDSEGYITEKLMDAFKAGCIPIYWGKNNFAKEDIINQKAILFYDPQNPADLKNKVAELWTNEEAYLQFIQEPPFLPDAPEKIWKVFGELESQFKKVIN